MDYDEAFIQDILEHPEDAGLRLIYADWLEERDDPRGTFLRLEAELRAARNRKGRRQVRKQLQRLREGIDPAWLARLDRTSVENCRLRLRFKFECPKRWEKLAPTEDPQVRFCDSCRQAVHYCGSVAKAQEHANLGHCVAVDSRELRKAGDLRPHDPEASFITLGIALPTHDYHDPRRLIPDAHVLVTDGEWAGAEATVVGVDWRAERLTAHVIDRDTGVARQVDLRWDQFEVV